MDADNCNFDTWLQLDYPNSEKYYHRKFLPSPMNKHGETLNVWNIMKSHGGKDLSKIAMPIHLNEPISFLQRISEYLEYSNIIFQACIENDPIARLEIITSFVISASSSSYKRSGKPFNPLLGETYEINRKEERGYIFVSEQVSHHPPVSAFFTEAEPHFRFWGSLYPKLKFRGTSLEVFPKGNLYLHLLKHDEIYTWQNVPSIISNPFIGRISISHNGENVVRCLSTNTKVVIKWKAGGLFKSSEDSNNNLIEAYLYDSEANLVKVVYGSWNETLFASTKEEWNQRRNKKSWKAPFTDTAVSGVVSKLGNIKFFNNCSFQLPTSISIEATESISSETNYSPLINRKTNERSSSSCASSPTNSDDVDLNIPNQTVLWQVSPRPPHSRLYYNFTYFALMLNEIPRKHYNLLPPTDSRRRPDIRLLEQGKIDEAANEKFRLEEKQRLNKKKLKSKKSAETQKALWFDYQISKYCETEEWIFNFKYFDRNWSDCPDIF